MYNYLTSGLVMIQIGKSEEKKIVVEWLVRTVQQAQFLIRTHEAGKKTNQSSKDQP